MPAILEHANITVSDPAATALWMEKLFGWTVRWEGDATMGGHTKHVGTTDHYVALYTPGAPDRGRDTLGAPDRGRDTSYQTLGGLNHVGVVVQDLDATEAAVKAHGFETSNHGDYEPGRRFYFHDADGVEFEVVAYD